MSNHFTVNEGPYLQSWYPGLGEVHVLKTLPRPVLSFLCEASLEDPEFVGDYLVAALSMPDARERICSDLSDAVMEYDLETRGMGGMGLLGKSIFKRAKAAVQRVHSAVAKKILPKALRKIDTKIMKSISKVDTKIHDTTKKVWKKYGNTIIMVVGAVASVFVGPAALAAASALTSANTAYAKKRAADAAKKAARADAGALAADAAAADAALKRQLDDFYNQNQAWFAGYGITPDKWAGLSLEAKIELINAGAEGRLPRDPGPGTSAPPSGAPEAMPGSSYTPPASPSGGYAPGPSGGGYSAPGGGGGDPSSVWGGSGIGPSGSTSPYQQGAAVGKPAQAQASMFGDSGMMLPMLALGAVAILGSQKKGKGGGSRKRRNPGRRRRW